ncbi:interferon gamma receptor 2 isoform X2 [Dermochelys coriacea]|uniref:interferon gamma receptor 2 isoform X2 n=1 Tax=Dermochelys coriacea TaxID=27794 RepID=UPI001CA9C7E7|nr:interferon gamma receptor 2 isoform X2 [Dermochelys coriacea]
MKPEMCYESPFQLPAPQNMTVYSYNYQNLLRWAPVKVDNGSVLYTVQYSTPVSCLLKVANARCPRGNEQNRMACACWEEINCTNITKTECNFTHPNIKSFWTITLRVRAELGQVKSDWVETNTFVADQNTIIGPPVIVNVDSTPDSLFLSFVPPVKEDTLQYLARYWEKSTNKQHETEWTKNTRIGLLNLKQLTEYCFQLRAKVQVLHDNIGPLSKTDCHRTAASDATRAGFVVIIFVAATITVVFLAIVCFLFIQKFHQVVKYWFQPPFKIPPHIEEYLKDPGMPVLEELQNNCAEEDPWDSLSVVSNAEGSQALVKYTLNTHVHSDSRSIESGKNLIILQQKDLYQCLDAIERG